MHCPNKIMPDYFLNINYHFPATTIYYFTFNRFFSKISGHFRQTTPFIFFEQFSKLPAYAAKSVAPK